MSRAAASILLVALAAKGCDRGVLYIPDTPGLEQMITATAGAEGINFTVVASIAGAEVASARGVLDLVTGEGYREDAALVSGGGVDPVAEVWLSGGVQYQRELGEEETSVINGSAGSFLAITSAPDAPTLEEALRRTFDGKGWEAVASEEIDGEEAGTLIAAMPARADQRRVEVIVGSADVIRELHLSGVEETVERVVVIILTPGPVEVPARPE